MVVRLVMTNGLGVSTVTDRACVLVQTGTRWTSKEAFAARGMLANDVAVASV